MRNELQHLENELVFIKGRVLKKNVRQDLDNTVDVLVTPAKLYRWNGSDSFDPENAELAAQTDHIWIRMPIPQASHIELLMEVYSFGKVNYYTKADGSIDLTVDVKPSVNLDQLLMEAKESLDAYDQEGTAALRRVLEDLEFGMACLYHQGDGGYAYSSVMDLNSAAEGLVRAYKRIKSSADAIDTRLATATSNGPCTRMRDTLHLPSCKRQRSVGFA